MKKFFILISLYFFTFSALFSQNSKTSYASNANRTTAIRCLKLAESCLVGKDFVSAKNQAETGFSYGVAFRFLCIFSVVGDVVVQKIHDGLFLLIS